MRKRDDDDVHLRCNNMLTACSPNAMHDQTKEAALWVKQAWKVVCSQGGARVVANFNLYRVVVVAAECTSLNGGRRGNLVGGGCLI